MRPLVPARRRSGARLGGAAATKSMARAICGNARRTARATVASSALIRRAISIARFLVKPGRAAVSVTADTVERIAERTPTLVGMKHAANDLELLTELLSRLGPEFRIFCGLESLSLPMLAIGACGLMNAVGNIAPARVAALYNEVAGGNLEAARKLHFELFDLNRAIFLDTNPIPLKYMMQRLGLLESAELRLPLVPIDAERGKTLDDVLAKAGLLLLDELRPARHHSIPTLA